MGRFAPDDVLENADVYEKFTELAPMDVTKCKKVSSVQVNPVYTTFSELFWFSLDVAHEYLL